VRSIIGRGYSPRTFSTSIFSAHGVMILFPTGEYAYRPNDIENAAAAVNKDLFISEYYI
jgi:hypothetical protein